MIEYAIVTGVASGIGECIANDFVKRGIVVFGIDVNEPKNGLIKYFKCDIRDEERIIEVMSEIKKITDRIDYLINVAGIFCDATRNYIENLSKEEWQTVIDVNLTGTFLISKYTIPFLKKSSNGNIISLSTEQVKLPQEKGAPYAVTKAGLEMFSKILALELMNSKIRVNVIELASVRTNFLKRYKKDDNLINEMMKKTNKDMPYGIIEPEDVLKMVNFLIYDGCKITGQSILIDSGVVLNFNKRK